MSLYHCRMGWLTRPSRGIKLTFSQVDWLTTSSNAESTSEMVDSRMVRKRLRVSAWIAAYNARSPATGRCLARAPWRRAIRWHQPMDGQLSRRLHYSAVAVLRHRPTRCSASCIKSRKATKSDCATQWPNMDGIVQKKSTFDDDNSERCNLKGWSVK
jgi:hypothetical protein